MRFWLKLSNRILIPVNFSKWSVCGYRLELHINGYYQHLSLSYKRWHWWRHDVIIECLEAIWRQIWCRSLSKSVFFCWFVYFCSAIFVPQFLFCYFCSTIFVSTWAFLHLNPIYHILIDNFCSADLFALARLPILFLFCYFCSAIFVLLGPFFVPLFLFAIFVLLTFLHLHVTNFVPLFLFHWGLFALILKTNLCSAQFLFRWGTFFVLLFLFHYFCSTDLFALALTNFCSAIFVLLFLFCYFWNLLGPFCT